MGYYMLSIFLLNCEIIITELLNLEVRACSTSIAQIGWHWRNSAVRFPNWHEQAAYFGRTVSVEIKLKTTGFS